MRVGYIRVSTVDQNTVRHLDGVEVERVFTDALLSPLTLASL